MILPLISIAAKQRLDEARPQGNESPYPNIAFAPRLSLLDAHPGLHPSPDSHRTLRLPPPSLRGSHLNPTSPRAKTA